MNAFITNKNKPNVKNVIGMVSIINKGLTKLFNTAKTIATKQAVMKLLTCIPGKR